ncbi:hypothetical protein DSAG12_01448 [Promethearchaeum syntrophicum]|uniref:Uncharacterized protein n=1 Tax=Promethearchaeum syntrophicum TaxID=2594042 RepID=A0A5B9D944_9ARCH|nr:hypothetical protein [Candidatus Prometheoarchaeum syntrophicum]QEE15622.1 hypothetical protein DSAG12_01448 [Candidatus Prometheoarchaeum syntrophicum]
MAKKNTITKKPTTLDMLHEFAEYTGKEFAEVKNLYEKMLIKEKEKNFNKWDGKILDKRVLVKLRNLYDESQFVLYSKKFNSMWFLYFSKNV